MEGMVRRVSGVYVARLVVPLRLRALVGKRELVQSTGSRELAEAKVLASQIQAGWRRALREAERTAHVNVLQLKAGSPKLSLGGYLSLIEASEASGLDPSDLLRHAVQGQLAVLLEPGDRDAYVVPTKDLTYDGETGGYEVPPAHLLPPSALPVRPALVEVDRRDLALVRDDLLAGKSARLMALPAPNRKDHLYCPVGGIDLRLTTLKVPAVDVERLRAAAALNVTSKQLALAMQPIATRSTSPHAGKRVLDVLPAYMAERERQCSEDQARRVRAACELFAELMDNPPIGDIDRAMLRRYRDEVLPTVPADENKLRLQHGSTSVRESMEKVTGTDWARISEGEVRKRMQWLCGLFKWLHEEKMLPDDPGVGLARSLRGKREAAASGDRDLFTRDDLTKIFSAPWFATGKGVITRAGTYREFLPFYFWLPLLGLYTGGRINELCQLHLDDIRQTPSGTWYIDINTDAPEDGEAAVKRTKNVQSVRRVPMHPHLIELGLPQWRERLAAEGHQRLFPELRYNKRKGFSAPAVKWFSQYLKRLGWARDGKKVFHSFRHTVATECVNALKLPDSVVCQFTGHNRAAGQLARYRKDEAVDELSLSVAKLDFGLPVVAAFDVEAGAAALRDALRRKRTAKSPAALDALARIDRKLNL